MKTKIQDLDDKTFKSLIADKLGKCVLQEDNNSTRCEYPKTKPTEYCSHVKDENSSSSDRSPPILVKEEPVYNYDDQFKPNKDFNFNSGSTYSRKNTFIGRNQIKKSCGCSDCKSSSLSTQGKILKREDFLQSETYTTKDFEIDAKTSKRKEKLKNTIKYNPLDSKSFHCDTCSKKFLTYEQLVIHRKLHQTHSEKLLYECEECNQRFWSGHLLQVHCRMQHSGQDDGITCDICRLVFPSENSLTEHIKTHKMKQIIKCEPFEDGYSEKIQSNDNMNSHNEHRLFECHSCKATFLSESGLSDHLRTHESEKIHKCVICNERFSSDKTLEEHVLTHIGLYPYKCDKCGAGFHYKNHLIEHEYVHNSGKLLKCNMCSQMFTSQSVMDKHICCHNIEARRMCHICRKVFDNQISLATHVKMHKEIKHSCEQCGQTFRTKALLVKHEASCKNDSTEFSSDDDLSDVSEISSFDCDLCYNKFRTLKELQSHFYTHADDDQPTPKKNKTCYECALCSMRFRKSEKLRNHIVTHTPPPLSITCRCQICGEGFTQLSSLESHIRSSHTKNYQCDICDRTFRIEKDLEEHILSHFDKDKELSIKEPPIVNQREYVLPEEITNEKQSEIFTPLSNIDTERNGVVNTKDNIPIYDVVKTESIDNGYFQNLPNGYATQGHLNKDFAIQTSKPHVQMEATVPPVKDGKNSIGVVIDNTPSPRGFFSPRSDTDSGYSDKHNIVTSDTESAYSPLCAESDVMQIDKSNTLRNIYLHNSVHVEKKDIHPDAFKTDIAIDSISENKCTIGFDCGNVLTSNLHGHLPSIQEEDFLSTSFSSFMPSHTKSQFFGPSEEIPIVNNPITTNSKTQIFEHPMDWKKLSHDTLTLEDHLFSDKHEDVLLAGDNLFLSDARIDTPTSFQSSVHTFETQQEAATGVPSRKRSHDTSSDDDNISSDKKIRVPFFSFRGKKSHLPQSNHVNFHLLGKLK